jgi:hypothetical protein
MSNTTKKVRIIDLIARYQSHYENVGLHQPVKDYWRFILLDVVLPALPSGSGIDNGTKFRPDLSCINTAYPKSERLVFNVSFHHMNEHGYYTHWSDYTIRVFPTFLGGIDVKVQGSNYNGVREYLEEVFYMFFKEAEVDEPISFKEWMAKENHPVT